MRKSTLLWLVLAAGCGTVLFHTSQKVHDGREHLREMNLTIAKEEESLRVLSAEWGYLNQPARLEKLTKAYLKLAPLKATQFTNIDDIPLRTAAAAAAEAPIEEPVAKTVSVPGEKTPAPSVQKPAPLPAVAAASAVPPVKIIKPAPPATLAKAPAPKDRATAANNRNFADLMKSLKND